jgi:tRNA G18 (ribose-2'-O)-methylase SpoU
MANGVESLNVAITAALVAFHLQSMATQPAHNQR